MMSNHSCKIIRGALINSSCRRRPTSRVLQTLDPGFRRDDGEEINGMFPNATVWYSLKSRIAQISSVIACLVCAAPVLADKPVFKIEISNHLFMPSELVIPANTKVKLMVYNLDSTSEEFESYELNREKVIMGKRKAVIFVGPLMPGEYPFFGEFHPETAQGKIIAE
jgi:hypothetical protein